MKRTQIVPGVMMMSVFKEEKDFKRVIFNVEAGVAERLERAKDVSRRYGKKLDVDSAIDKALEKFLVKAEKKLAEMEEDFEKKKAKGKGKHKKATNEDVEAQADPQREELAEGDSQA